MKKEQNSRKSISTLSIIQMRDVSASYDSKNSVLKNISMNVHRGTNYAIVGASGSGKSTLLHIIALLDKPTSGEVFFDKKSFSKSTDKEKDFVRKKKISIIYQQNNLLSDFTALENVMIPLLNIGISKNESQKKATEILSSLNLDKRLSHFPNEMSGGEQQRVAVARALVIDPELILADEPTGSLDTKTSNEIFSIFLKLKSKSRAILYATHNRELADRADYKLSILDGNITRKKNG